MTDVHQDIYEGLTNEIPQNKPIIFSLGHRCTSTSLIKEMHQKFESYPFDWIVTKLDTIAHCIEDDFTEFLKIDNYDNMTSETFNICDGEKRHIINENVIYNKYYEEQSQHSNDIGTYGMKLCMTHHDIRKEKDYQYFERCIQRFRNILSSNQKKYYLYTHPIMGFLDYVGTLDNTKKYFTYFTEFLKTKTQNSFGIYFLLVQCEDRKGIVDCIVKNDDYVIYVIFANKKLIDGGGVFCGEDWYTEQHQILKIIETIIL